MARYVDGRNRLEKLTSSWAVVNITPKGVDDVEGRPQEATPITNFIFNAPVYSSVIGTHNPAELINNFDLSSIEERIEREGDADAEEPREALAVRYVISLKKAKRWIVAPCRGSARRCSGHEWFTGSVVQALLRFATQASG